MDVLFDDGEGTIVPEAAAVVAAGPRLEIVVEIELGASTWLAVSAAAMMMSERDSADEIAGDVATGAGPEAPAEGLNAAVRPQSSAAAPTRATLQDIGNSAAKYGYHVNHKLLIVASPITAFYENECRALILSGTVTGLQVGISTSATRILNSST